MIESSDEGIESLLIFILLAGTLFYFFLYLPSKILIKKPIKETQEIKIILTEEEYKKLKEGK